MAETMRIPFDVISHTCVTKVPLSTVIFASKKGLVERVLLCTVIEPCVKTYMQQENCINVPMHGT